MTQEKGAKKKTWEVLNSGTCAEKKNVVRKEEEGAGGDR